MVQRNIVVLTVEDVGEVLKIGRSNAYELFRSNGFPSFYVGRQLSEPTKLTVGEWLDYWLKEFKYRHVEHSSYDFYESKVRVHLIPNLENIKLQELNTLQIQSMINRLGMKLSATTLKNIYLTLNQALEKSVDLGYINKNPAKQCTLPKKKKDEKRGLRK